MTIRSGTFALLAALVGCTQGVFDLADDPELGSVSSAAVAKPNESFIKKKSCSPLCGRNSSVVNDGIAGSGLDGRLIEERVRNNAGVRIEALWAPGTDLDHRQSFERLLPVVIRDRLYGVDQLWYASDPDLHDRSPSKIVAIAREEHRLLEPEQLDHANLEISVQLIGPATTYFLEIRSRGTQPFQAHPTGDARTYELWFRTSTQPRTAAQPMCGTAARPLRAFVFAGDKYDPATITVSDEAQWYNIACLDTAVAKLHAMRHTVAGRPPGSNSAPWEARQAMLKLITADYCGSGTSHTEDGTALRWTDGMGQYSGHPWYSDVEGDEYLEALWDDSGAVCMNMPRIPAELERILRDCVRSQRVLPRCTDVDEDPVQDLPPSVNGFVVSEFAMSAVPSPDDDLFHSRTIGDGDTRLLHPPERR